MAHNLATIDGRTAMTFVGETPWHKLGTRMDSISSIHLSAFGVTPDDDEWSELRLRAKHSSNRSFNSIAISRSGQRFLFPCRRRTS